MIKYTVEVDGMMCGMCEAHSNDTVRRTFPDVKKVSSSHGKGLTTFTIEHEIDEEVLRKAITDLGYDVGKITHETVEKKKGLFSFLG